MEIDSIKSKILVKIVDFLKTNNILTILVLIPYHPLNYNSLINNDRYKIIVQCEEWFRKLVKNHNIRIIGSYNPGNLHLKETDFYDYMHPNEIVYDKIIKELF